MYIYIYIYIYIYGKLSLYSHSLIDANTHDVNIIPLGPHNHILNLS